MPRLSTRARRVAVRSTLLACLTALVASASASAATLCVQMPAPTACDATFVTLQGAIDAADTGDPAIRDTIRIGPVTLVPEAAEAFDSNPVDIVGSGRDVTRLQTPIGPFSDAALTIGDTSTVSDLAITINDVAGAPSFEEGLDLGDGSSATRVAVTGEGGMDNATGVHVRAGSTLTDSSVELPLGLANAAVGLEGGARLENLSLVAEVAVDLNGSGDPVVVDRVRTRRPVGEAVRVRGGGDLHISNSLLRIVNDPNAVGLAVAGASGGTITARHLTIIGEGEGIGLDAFSPSALIDLRDSILHGMTTSVRRGGSGTPTVTLAYSNFNPATFDQSGATGGSIVQGAGNLNVNPLFAGFANYHLRPTSQLIDRGSPDPGPLTVDLDGQPRVMDGDGNGIFRRDIGAFEYLRLVTGPPPLPPPDPVDSTPPVLSGLSLSRKRFRVGRRATPRVAAAQYGTRPTPVGTRVRYRLSEKAKVRFTVQRVLPGRRIRLRGRRRCVKPTLTLVLRNAKRCKRFKRVGVLVRSGVVGKNSFAFSGRIGKRKLRPGRYRMRVVATDAAGNPSTVRLTAFRVVRR